MGGKGDDGGSQQQDQSALMRQQQAQQAAATAQSQKTAAAPVETPPKTDDQTGDAAATKTPPPTTQQTTGNLTGLGDALVSGLNEGRVQQVKDQTDRVTANPQTYAPQFDPYSGTFTGQGPYTGTTQKTGQV